VAHRFPIKARATAALSIPLAMLVGVAALEVTDTMRDVVDVAEQAERAQASIGPSGVVNAIMNERNYTSLWLVGTEGVIDLPVDSLDEARQRTDGSVEAFREELGGAGDEVRAIYGPALDALDQLDEQRAMADSYDGERNIAVDNPVRDEVWEGYSDLVTTLSDLTTELAYAIEDDDLRLGVQLIDLAVRQVDRFSKAVRVSMAAAVRGGGSIEDQQQYAEAVRLHTEGMRHHDRILELAGPTAFGAAGDELQVESAETGMMELTQQIVEENVVDIAGLLDAVSIEPDESYYGFVADVSDVIRDRADHLQGEAERRQRTVLAVAALVLLVGAAATLLVARSISRPLRSLTRQARDIADRALPQAVRSVHEVPLGQDVVVPDLGPVRVRTRDEVADVADMLTTVQTTALDLAVEQAVLRRNATDSYVNLARRYQDLLGRHIDDITQLESSETRPEVLADLYVLDHQATRMRRNAESLLVLAGAEPRPRTTAPVRMSDVVRAALGEVSDYERVAIKGIQPAVVTPSAVTDLAHLLAELIDNALRFSPDDEPVEVRGHGRVDGYKLAVIDRGEGMSSEDIARANRRLARAEAHTIAPSSYLGHYVTATLAARHGITVLLQPAAVGQGTAATVHLPPDLLLPVDTLPHRTGDVPVVPESAVPPETLPGAGGPVAPPSVFPLSAPAGYGPPPSSRGTRLDRLIRAGMPTPRTSSPDAEASPPPAPRPPAPAAPSTPAAPAAPAAFSARSGPAGDPGRPAPANAPSWASPPADRGSAGPPAPAAEPGRQAPAAASGWPAETPAWAADTADPTGLGDHRAHGGHGGHGGHDREDGYGHAPEDEPSVPAEPSVWSTADTSGRALSAPMTYGLDEAARSRPVVPSEVPPDGADPFYPAPTSDPRRPRLSSPRPALAVPPMEGTPASPTRRRTGTPWAEADNAPVWEPASGGPTPAPPGSSGSPGASTASGGAAEPGPTPGANGATPVTGQSRTPTPSGAGAPSPTTPGE
jgi:signal transduction histidine kinase